MRTDGRGDAAQKRAAAGDASTPGYVEEAAEASTRTAAVLEAADEAYGTCLLRHLRGGDGRGQ